MEYSTPLTVVDNPNLSIPQRDMEAYIQFMKKSFPELPVKVAATRMCWYCDSFDGDFFITPVPNEAKNLIVACGGSGHAFKFTPGLCLI